MAASLAMRLFMINVLVLCLVTLGKGATTGSLVSAEIGSVTLKYEIEDSRTEDSNSFPHKAYVTCECKGPHVWSWEVNANIAEAFYHAMLKNHSYLTENECTGCKLQYYMCLGKDSDNCTIGLHKYSKKVVIRSSARRFEFSRERPFLRIVSRKNESNTLYFPMGVQEKNGLRVKRMAGRCVTPMALEFQNAEFFCYHDEDFNGTKCMQRCAWGHTLPYEGIRQFLKCYDDSINEYWEPHSITACEAFVDCGIDLIYPGTVDCTPITIYEGPTCKVSCDRYEDRTAVPQDVFKCDINGQWNKEFPFCAVRSAGKILAKPPKKKLHDDKKKDLSLFYQFIWKERTPEFKLKNRKHDDFARWMLKHKFI